MILQQTALALITAVFLASSTSTEAHDSKNCTRSCGQGKSAKQVTYPFGFSEDCEIRLNCTKDNIIIGGFQVKSITPTSIFINLPAKCNRSINSISRLFGDNYGLSLNNSLLLRNCNSTSTVIGCSIPTSFVEKQFSNLEGCSNTGENDTIRCYSPERDRVELLNFTDVQNTKCGFLFSSATVNSSNSTVSLELQRLELEWWLTGKHDCDPNATTEEIRLQGGKSGFRCHCKDGFHGDGFVGGLGCQGGESTRYYNKFIRFEFSFFHFF